MVRLGCLGEGSRLLYSCIERANSSSFSSKIRKRVLFLVLAFIFAMCMIMSWADKNCVFTMSVVFLGTVFFLINKGLYFMKAQELSYGLDCLATANWWYMELWFNDRKNYSFFFGRIMRSPAFILIAGFYYQLKVGDSTSAEKLLELARARAPELQTIEISSVRGLHRRDREILMDRLRKDLGVVWLYKNYKRLLAALYIFYFMLCALLIVVLFHVVRLVI